MKVESVRVSLVSRLMTSWLWVKQRRVRLLKSAGGLAMAVAVVLVWTEPGSLAGKNMMSLALIAFYVCWLFAVNKMCGQSLRLPDNPMAKRLEEWEGHHDGSAE